MGFLSSCGCVNATVWMHNMDANKMHREKARLKLHKNSTSYIEQILNTTPPQNNTSTATYLPSQKLSP